MEIPIITLTVESVRHQVHHALTNYELEISSEIHKALDAALTPAMVQATVTREVQRTLDRVIAEEVDRHYRSGAGRGVIRAELETMFAASDKAARERLAAEQEDYR